MRFLPTSSDERRGDVVDALLHDVARPCAAARARSATGVARQAGNAACAPRQSRPRRPPASRQREAAERQLACRSGCAARSCRGAATSLPSTNSACVCAEPAAHGRERRLEALVHLLGRIEHRGVGQAESSWRTPLQWTRKKRASSRSSTRQRVGQLGSVDDERRREDQEVAARAERHALRIAAASSAVSSGGCVRPGRERRARRAVGDELDARRTGRDRRARRRSRDGALAACCSSAKQRRAERAASARSVSRPHRRRARRRRRRRTADGRSR